ncbi:MAG: hypothetical protein WA996_19315 [Candidatus Promineifilaceae bacterium]
MNETSDLIVFWVVVLSRFLVPFTIPRFPLPGILACLIIDAVDQTIFQQFTNLELTGYQGYDKALDIYYLVIAYISTLRNWTNLFAFRVSQFLLYYRLFGVTLFELTYSGDGPRWLLLIFPNVFEYFFIFYEIVRLRWDPVKMTKRFVIISAAAIWIFIKIPQELWIHIFQLDTTDFIKETIFGVPADTPFSEILADNLWIIGLAVVLAILIVMVARWIGKRLPPADWPMSIDANDHLDVNPEVVESREMSTGSDRFFDNVLFEKIALVSLVSIIFAQILPEVKATTLQLAVAVAFVIILNTVVSHWLAGRGTTWRSTLQQFVAMVFVNFGLVLIYSFLLPAFDGSINVGNTLFFVLLLTLLVTMFDRYRPFYDMRVAMQSQSAAAE